MPQIHVIIRPSHYFVIFCITIFLTSPALAPPLPETAKLTADDGTTGDFFGASAAIDGQYAVIGAPDDDEFGAFSGSAYVFRWNGSNWQQQAKLTASDAGAYAFFGRSVAIDGERIVMGAPGTNMNGTAYLFTLSGNTWTQEARIEAGNPATLANFGQSVSISADRVLIGANGANTWTGAAHVFARQGSNWYEEAVLTASDGETSDDFGLSVSLDGAVAAIGARGDDDQGQAAGAVYLFRNNGSSWTEEAKIVAADGADDDAFGSSVSLFGDRVLVAAPNDDDHGNNCGAAYLFDKNGSTWQQSVKLHAGDASAEDAFGSSVSLALNRAVIGAYQDDDHGEDCGAAYLFTFDGNNYTEESKLFSSDAAAGDNLGDGVTTDGVTAFVGAPADDDNGINSGSVYVYDLPPLVGITHGHRNSLPAQVALKQNFPNPFNPVTTIEFSLPYVSRITLYVYDILGRKVKMLVDERKPAGRYTVQWDGTNNAGQPVATGVYLYQLKAEKYTAVRKMLLVK